MRKQVNHKTLILARESRGYTQTELADTIGIPQSVISKLENGTLHTAEKYLTKISEELNYPNDFFYQQLEIYPPNLHYRKRTVIPSKTRDMAEAMMNIYRTNIDLLLKGVVTPEVKFPILDEDRIQDPIEVATFIRHYWQLPRGRIENLAQLLESKGIIIVYCDFFTDKIDGRSMITEKGNYIIFLNKNAPGDRQRFTLAHEFAHIVLHLNSPSSLDRDVEDEANQFACEFLMPAQEIKPQVAGSRLTIPKLADLKRFWKVSMQAILKWSERLGVITTSQARYLWSQFNAMSIRRKEPVEIPIEKTEILEGIIRTYLNKLSYSKQQLAKLLCLNMSDYERLYSFKISPLVITR